MYECRVWRERRVWHATGVSDTPLPPSPPFPPVYARTFARTHVDIACDTNARARVLTRTIHKFGTRECPSECFSAFKPGHRTSQKRLNSKQKRNKIVKTMRDGMIASSRSVCMHQYSMRVYFRVIFFRLHFVHCIFLRILYVFSLNRNMRKSSVHIDTQRANLLHWGVIGITLRKIGAHMRKPARFAHSHQRKY